MSSPTQLSLKLLRDGGFNCEIVERFNAFAGPLHMVCPACGKNKIGKRHDYLGFCDIIAFRSDEIRAVQTTSASNHSARVEKIRGLLTARQWLASPNRKIFVHSWRQPGGEGTRWQCREVEVTLNDLGELQVQELVKQTRPRVRRGTTKKAEQIEFGQAVAF